MLQPIKELVVLDSDSGIVSMALHLYGDYCEKMGSPQELIDRIRDLEIEYKNKEST